MGLLTEIGTGENKIWTSFPQQYVQAWDDFSDKLLNGRYWNQLDDAELVHAYDFMQSLFKQYSINQNKKVMKIKLNDLKKAGKAINALELFDDEIDVKASAEEIQEKILEAVEEMDDDEIEELDEAVQETIELVKEAAEDEGEEPDEDEEEEKKPAKKAGKKSAKKETKKSKKEAPEDAPDELDDLTEQVEEAREDEDIDSLKELAKEHDVFADVRKGLQLQKNVEKLAKRMHVCLNAARGEEQQETKKDKKSKEAPKKDTKKAEKKETKKSNAPKMKRPEACIIALMKKPKTFGDWIQMANEVMEENGGSHNDQENKYHCRNIIAMSNSFDFGVKIPVE